MNKVMSVLANLKSSSKTLSKEPELSNTTPEESPKRGKRSMWPYKILCIFLFGYKPGMRRLGAGAIVLSTGTFARGIGINNNSRLIENLRILEKDGLIKELTVEYGSIILKVADPVGFTKEDL